MIAVFTANNLLHHYVTFFFNGFSMHVHSKLGSGGTLIKVLDTDWKGISSYPSTANLPLSLSKTLNSHLFSCILSQL